MKLHSKFPEILLFIDVFVRFRHKWYQPIPGITATVLRARSTRNVLSAERLPRSTPMVKYLKWRFFVLNSCTSLFKIYFWTNFYLALQQLFLVLGVHEMFLWPLGYLLGPLGEAWLHIWNKNYGAKNECMCKIIKIV